MPRIRSIKPEFWTSEALATRLPGPDGRQARLLFVALWNHAEDHGVCRASPALLRSQAFPYDEDVLAADVARWLHFLEAGGFVVLYQRDGSAYAWIRGFDEHQKIDRKSKTTLPTPTDDERESPRRALGEPSTSPRRRRGEEGKGEEGNGPPQPPPGGEEADFWSRLPPASAPLEPTPEPRPIAGAGWSLPDAVDAVHREVMEGRAYRWDMVHDEKAATVLMSLCAADGLPIARVPEEAGRRFGRALVRSLLRYERAAGKAVTLRELTRRECWSINAEPPRREVEERNPITGVLEKVTVAVEPWDAMLAKREAA